MKWGEWGIPQKSTWWMFIHKKAIYYVNVCVHTQTFLCLHAFMYYCATSGALWREHTYCGSEEGQPHGHIPLDPSLLSPTMAISGDARRPHTDHDTEHGTCFLFRELLLCHQVWVLMIRHKPLENLPSLCLSDITSGGVHLDVRWIDQPTSLLCGL